MENNEKIKNIRHTLSHLLAQAAKEIHPGSLLTLGPAVDNGFYYDIDFGDKKVNDDDLKKLEKIMKKNLSSWKEFSHKKVSPEEAREYYKDNVYKLELIDGIVERGEEITLYSCGDFTDLCGGGHVENPSKEIKSDSFNLDRVAGAYWRGDEKNKMLTRIYGLAFESKEALKEYEEMRIEAEKRDHKKLGKELDLFVFSETVGKGLPLFTVKGATIRRELERFIVDEEIRRGYQHVVTPDIANLELYKKSGHYPHYKDSMYAPIKIDESEYMLRPMTCPHHFELYLNKPHSYKELPLKIAELAKLYRYEQSGELMGLVRVRSFCLADAHIICASDKQAVEEIGKALDLIEYITSVFGLKLDVDYRYRLSLGDRNNTEKYYNDDSAWEKGEDLLRELMISRKSAFEEAKDEAAFYGPKIDIQMKNVNGKEDTAFTVQYDFCMPERFDLSYIGEDGKSHRAFVVHRSSIGAIERIMAFLIEKYAGAFPLWLSPVQVIITPISEKQKGYADEIYNKLKEKNIRVELDDSNESLGKRIRNAKLQKTPYVIVIGDKEKESRTVTLEGRDEKLEGITSEQLLEKLQKEISEKTLN